MVDLIGEWTIEGEATLQVSREPRYRIARSPRTHPVLVGLTVLAGLATATIDENLSGTALLLGALIASVMKVSGHLISRRGRVTLGEVWRFEFDDEEIRVGTLRLPRRALRRVVPRVVSHGEGPSDYGVYLVFDDRLVRLRCDDDGHAAVELAQVLAEHLDARLGSLQEEPGAAMGCALGLVVFGDLMLVGFMALPLKQLEGWLGVLVACLGWAALHLALHAGVQRAVGAVTDRAMTKHFDLSR